MLINIYSAKNVGIDAVPVNVEVDVNPGVGVHLVGLADIAVKESLLRIMTALTAVGYRIPGKKIVINLAPADMHKKGSGYDLPIALGILAASGQVDLPLLNDYLIMGELGLDASLRPVRAALPITELCSSMGLKGCILPLESALEAADCRQTKVYGVRSFVDVLRILSGEYAQDLEVWNSPEYVAWQSGGRSVESRVRMYPDFADISGQDGAKRGLEIAAAGGHNVIMVGAPGSGKTSLAKALCGILPPMRTEEALITSKIYSVSSATGLVGGLGTPGTGVLHPCGLMRTRPFRSPHYSISLPSLIGGGSGNIMPGEISLAHNGVLFLDEFTQMPKNVMEALRAPIEDRSVTISRLHHRVSFPCSFMLVAAANPCPCGYYGEGDRCSCTPSRRISYLSRLSGPIMDRIDIQLWLHSVPSSCLVNASKSESSQTIASRVMATREIQYRRFMAEPIFTNSEMNMQQLKRYCPLSPECESAMTSIMNAMKLSARAFHRIVKIARTIADLDGAENIEVRHINEAARLRIIDKYIG